MKPRCGGGNRQPPITTNMRGTNLCTHESRHPSCVLDTVQSINGPQCCRQDVDTALPQRWGDSAHLYVGHCSRMLLALTMKADASCRSSEVPRFCYNSRNSMVMFVHNDHARERSSTQPLLPITCGCIRDKRHLKRKRGPLACIGQLASPFPSSQTLSNQQPVCCLHACKCCMACVIVQCVVAIRTM